MIGGKNDDLNGLICVNKPQGFTSFDVIAKMRGILRLRRLGHAGTLDPMATGVLPVFVGKATKACDIIPDHDKTYRAGFRLGFVSDTQDSSGKMTELGGAEKVTAEKLEASLGDFRGDIMQIPPMYSAVTVNGKRLYDLARKGIEVEREARPVTIYKLVLTGFDEASHEGTLEISCSRGTYIRTVINDIGEKLGCGAVMTSLVRTAACGFSLSDCVSLEELQANADSGNSAEKYLLPIEKVFADYPSVKLDEHREKLYRNGVKLKIELMGGCIKCGGIHRVFGADGGFIGLGIANAETMEFTVYKNF